MNNNEIYKSIAEFAKNGYELDLFLEYLKLADLGVRKKSHIALNKFIKIAEKWDFEKRKNFCKKILSLKNEADNHKNLINYNLNKELLIVTLIEWINIEPNNHLPFHYLTCIHSYEYGKLSYDMSKLTCKLVPEFNQNNLYFHNKALELNPNDHKVRKYVINHFLYFCGYYPTHHLPEGYVGDFGNTPENDLEDLKKNIPKHLKFLPDSKQKNKFQEDYEYYVQLITDYIEFKKDDCKDFTEYTSKLNRYYHWVKAYYYK